MSDDKDGGGPAAGVPDWAGPGFAQLWDPDRLHGTCTKYKYVQGLTPLVRDQDAAGAGGVILAVERAGLLCTYSPRDD
jgi:hypothetical protein